MYLDELADWNQNINLTGVKTKIRMVQELLLDSLLPAPYLPHGSLCLDVGSGAGFPAIPLKICKPSLHYRLIEPSRKKVSFLKQVIRLTGLTAVEVVQDRMENQIRGLPPQGLEVITSRALTGLPRLVSWGALLLKPGGLLVQFCGGQNEETLQASLSLAHARGMELHRQISYAIPGKGHLRSLIILKNAVSS